MLVRPRVFAGKDVRSSFKRYVSNRLRKNIYTNRYHTRIINFDDFNETLFIFIRKSEWSDVIIILLYVLLKT